MEEAKNHEAKIELSKFVENYGWNGMNKDDVADMLLEHNVELYNIIKGLP
jgi:hypothetical protein